MASEATMGEHACVGDQPDARPITDEELARLKKSGMGVRPLETPRDGDMRTDGKYPQYNMDHPRRGEAILISNKVFSKTLQLGERTGTEADLSNLYQRFRSLGFDVTAHKDLTAMQMLKVLKDVANKDHSQCDCIAVAIMSHGDDGVIYGTDNVIPIDVLLEPFKGDKCSTLAGKPKLFFIQACRGSKFDAGVKVEADDSGAEGDLKKIPTEADFLIAYSVVPGYFSWRNSQKGSWFIQSLTQVLENAKPEDDILTLMTHVSYLVAYNFESNTTQEFMRNKKQIPCIVSMLTKQMRFPKKL